MKQLSKHAYPRLSTAQIITRIIAIIMFWEFVIMIFLGEDHLTLDSYLLAVIDSVLLSALSAPCIYFWVIRPFTQARDLAITELDQLAHTDPLTQLINRRGLFRHLEHWVNNKNKTNRSGAVLIIDLDGFKVINDVQGHDAGDAVLVEVAKRLHANLHPDDKVGRLGGDEFMVLLTNLDPSQDRAEATATELANQLCCRLKQGIRVASQTLHVGASIGIRVMDMDEIDTGAIIKDADTAMYYAKQSGKSCAIMYSENKDSKPTPVPMRC